MMNRSANARRRPLPPQRVELVETKTTMRYAFEAAVATAAQTADADKLGQLKELFDGTTPRAGIRKRPGWRVSRRGRKGRR